MVERREGGRDGCSVEWLNGGKEGEMAVLWVIAPSVVQGRCDNFVHKTLPVCLPGNEKAGELAKLGAKGRQQDKCHLPENEDPHQRSPAATH